MAQVRDLVVTGPTRLIGEAYGRISSANTVPVQNQGATLAFGSTTTIGTVGGVAITVGLPNGGQQGPQGPKGANGSSITGNQGPQGPQGPKGSDATAGFTVSNGSSSGPYYLLGVTGTTTGQLTSGYRAGTSTSNGVYWQNWNLYATSDERMKDFHGPVDIDFERLKNIPKVYYTWKNDPASKMNIGTSAQELQEVYPEIVDTNENGILAVAYDKLSIIALAAIDELKKENDGLRNEIKELRTRLEILRQL